MKRALLVSPYFTPSNLAGVMRTRLLASHLPEFGWEPIVVCVDPACYEEPNDEASRALLPQRLRVEKVGAWPAKVCRPLGFGDVALRAQFAMRRRVGELARRGEADLVFATVQPGCTSLVGAWAKAKLGLPFVLDYQDPWVSDWGAKQPRISKAGISHRLATWLEPGAVKQADALTAVSDGTLDTLRARKLIRNGTPIEIIPIGADVNDHAVAARIGISQIPTSGLRSPTSEFHLAYVGTIIEGMLPSVRTLFRAVRAILDEKPARQPRIHFIGTSAQPDGRDALGLERMAAEVGVRAVFRIEPRRVGYLDALRTMQDADALLLLGSQDAHYTASKIFPCWLSGKPVLGLFHGKSTVNNLAAELGGVEVVTYNNGQSPETQVGTLTAALRNLSEHGLGKLPPRNGAGFEPYSARGVAQKFAALFDRVVAKQIG